MPNPINQSISILHHQFVADHLNGPTTFRMANARHPNLESHPSLSPLVNSYPPWRSWKTTIKPAPNISKLQRVTCLIQPNGNKVSGATVYQSANGIVDALAKMEIVGDIALFGLM